MNEQEAMLSTTQYVKPNANFTLGFIDSKPPEVLLRRNENCHWKAVRKFDGFKLFLIVRNKPYGSCPRSGDYRFVLCWPDIKIRDNFQLSQFSNARELSSQNGESSC